MEEVVESSTRKSLQKRKKDIVLASISFCSRSILIDRLITR